MSQVGSSEKSILQGCRRSDKKIYPGCISYCCNPEYAPYIRRGSPIFSGLQQELIPLKQEGSQSTLQLTLHSRWRRLGPFTCWSAAMQKCILIRRLKVGFRISWTTTWLSSEPDDPRSTECCVIKVLPESAELSEMFGTMNKRIWRPSRLAPSRSA